MFKLRGFLHVQESARAKSLLLRSRRGAVESTHELFHRHSIWRHFRWHWASERSYRPEKLLVGKNLNFGSSGRIRTYDQSVNPD